MIKLQAVVEVPMFDEGPAPWPVAAAAPGSWLVLDTGCTADQVGLFVAALAARIDVASPGGRDEVLDALLAEEALIVAGGLQVSDTETGTVVVPGCCSGLEDWREWTGVLTGDSLWLGHDPGPHVEVVGPDLRVWQDGGPNRERGRWAGQRVDLPCRELPQLLLDVQRDLAGFLNALADWAEQTGIGPRGTALVQMIDQNFAVTAPLELPAG
ncbi:hypothetical protein [Actinoplanes couchii]|uniref:Uncharacterized protein n=1 Tax=Actinoplanes couchii TaxID=403638 RepID=A0ABQ3XPI5_9ACTN|nr:hypothetical protein [Actinoplanes couchii]MDR6319056.1 hypothetical protein [Actinoplanes couchii]GID60398.1 hypothetical protein Aco03nite_088020 [Actinoplanes couchii]